MSSEKRAPVADAPWVFNAFGLKISLRLADAEVERLARARMPVFGRLSPQGGIDREYCVYRSEEGLRWQVDEDSPRDVGDALATANELVSDLQIYLATKAAKWVFIHAGVVRFESRVILIAGGSGSGKSTLVAAFTSEGAAYASDELAVLDASGLVHSYARPLALRSDDGGIRRILASELPGGEMREPGPVDLVLLPRFGPGGSWQPRLLSPGQAMLELLRHTVGLRARPAASLAALRLVTERAPALAGMRGEAQEVVESIRDLTER